MLVDLIRNATLSTDCAALKACFSWSASSSRLLPIGLPIRQKLLIACVSEPVKIEYCRLIQGSVTFRTDFTPVRKNTVTFYCCRSVRNKSCQIEIHYAARIVELPSSDRIRSIYL